jgi:hypothetical protein
VTPLRQRLTLPNRSPEMIRGYVNVIAQYAKYYGRSPEQLRGDAAINKIASSCRRRNSYDSQANAVLNVRLPP